MPRLVLPRRLRRRELGSSAAALAEVVSAWRKGIFAELPAKGVDGCRLLKAYVTTPLGARRTLFLLQAASGDTVFLLHRPKGDPIGDNMAYANKAFRVALERTLRIAAEDIAAGAFDVVQR
jgi:hypothetical protein